MFVHVEWMAARPKPSTTRSGGWKTLDIPDIPIPGSAFRPTSHEGRAVFGPRHAASGLLPDALVRLPAARPFYEKALTSRTIGLFRRSANAVIMHSP